MDQAALENETDFVVHRQMLLDRDGEHLVAIVKATFELVDPASSLLEIAPEERARPLRFADVPWEEDVPSSLLYPADLCLRKPGVDLVFVGSAHAQGDRPVREIDARIEAGHLGRSLRVHGPRRWASGVLTNPEPFLTLDMRYDHAWGGRDESDPKQPIEEARNPIGSGFVLDERALEGKPAPRIEDAADPIASSKYRGAPAGLGAIARSWEPRRSYVGTYDDRWRETRAPLLPDDFDDRHHLCGSAGLSSEKPLAPGAELRLLNLTPGGGARSIVLPRVAPLVRFVVFGRGDVEVRPRVDTVVVDWLAVSEEKPAAVELVFRASIKSPRRMKDARIVVTEEPS